MTKDGEAAVQAARISARQAVLVALITGIVSILTTLIATGVLTPGTSLQETSASEGAGTSEHAVLEAPILHFSSVPTDAPLEACMQKANRALDKGLELVGIRAQRYYTWGYQQDTIGLIWCHTDEELVIFLSSGTDDPAAAQMAEALRRSF